MSPLADGLKAQDLGGELHVRPRETDPVVGPLQRRHACMEQVDEGAGLRTKQYSSLNSNKRGQSKH